MAWLIAFLAAVSIEARTEDDVKAQDDDTEQLKSTVSQVVQMVGSLPLPDH